MEPRKGRKAFARNIILSPLQGSTLLSALNPGLAPGAILLPPLWGWARERSEFRDSRQLSAIRCCH